MSLAGGSVYPVAVDAFLRGEIDATTAAIRAQLCSAFPFDPTHADASDITGALGDPTPVTVTNVADGAIWVDPILFPTVPAGTVTACVAYVEGGPLLCHISRRADAVPLALTTDGNFVRLNFGRLLKL